MKFKPTAISVALSFVLAAQAQTTTITLPASSVGGNTQATVGIVVPTAASVAAAATTAAAAAVAAQAQSSSKFWTANFAGQKQCWNMSAVGTPIGSNVGSWSWGTGRYLDMPTVPLSYQIQHPAIASESTYVAPHQTNLCVSINADLSLTILEASNTTDFVPSTVCNFNSLPAGSSGPGASNVCAPQNITATVNGFRISTYTLQFKDYAFADDFGNSSMLPNTTLFFSRYDSYYPFILVPTNTSVGTPGWSAIDTYQGYYPYVSAAHW